MKHDQAALDRITDKVLAYRRPQKSVKARAAVAHPARRKKTKAATPVRKRKGA